MVIDMKKIEYKVCRKCKKMYRWESGGIIMTPQDHMDNGLCEICRTKETIKFIGSILVNKK